VAEPTPANESPLPRQAQMFPKLSEADIERIRPFASLRHFASGALLCMVGEPSEGMFVVLQGAVAISQHDGLGHVVPIVRHRPGNFIVEVGMVSGRPALVDGRKLGRAGRGVPVAAGGERLHADPRAEPGGEHVSLPDRPHREHIQHRASGAHRADRVARQARPSHAGRPATH
jgi:hypothetical protein